jgi:hypothetical protein
MLNEMKSMLEELIYSGYVSAEYDIDFTKWNDGSVEINIFWRNPKTNQFEAIAGYEIFQYCFNGEVVIRPRFNACFDQSLFEPILREAFFNLGSTSHTWEKVAWWAERNEIKVETFE